MLIKSCLMLGTRCLQRFWGMIRRMSMQNVHFSFTLRGENELEQAQDMLGMFETFVKHVAHALAKFVSHPDNCKNLLTDGAIRKKKPPRKKVVG